MSKTRIKLFVILGLFGILPSIAFAQNQQKQTVIDFNLHYKNKQVNIVSIDKRQGFLPDYLNQPQKGYTLQLLDGSTKELFKVKFNFPTTILSDDFSSKQASGSVQELSEADQTITTPYLADAKKVYILNPNGQVIASQELNLEKLQTYAEDQKNVAQKAKTETAKKAIYVLITLAAIASIIKLLLYLKHKHQMLKNENNTNSGNNLNK